MTDKQDAFDPANFGPVALIQMMRIYDLLIALLSSVDEEKAMKITEMHEQGITLAPNPKFLMED